MRPATLLTVVVIALLGARMVTAKRFIGYKAIYSPKKENRQFTESEVDVKLKEFNKIKRELETQQTENKAVKGTTGDNYYGYINQPNVEVKGETLLEKKLLSKLEKKRDKQRQIVEEIVYQPKYEYNHVDLPHRQEPESDDQALTLDEEVEDEAEGDAPEIQPSSMRRRQHRYAKKAYRPVRY